MSKLRIKTCDEFEAALRTAPATARLAQPGQPPWEDGRTGSPELRPYALWNALLDLVHEAMGRQDWTPFKALLQLYDGVERAGRRSEMYDASYVAFLEDVKLPQEPALLREVWRHSPPAFLKALERDRRSRPGP